MYQTIVVIVLVIYLVLSIFVYFLSNSNFLPNRRSPDYNIGFNAELKYMVSAMNPRKKIAYWVAKQENSHKNVILLHGFTRTSKRLEKRAEIYWDLGYNLFFVDNLGHGYSSDLLYPSGYRYAFEVMKLVKEENIVFPILHGLSMGAIASSVIAQLEPDLPKAIICEALPYDFDNLYTELLRYLGIPYFMFPWLEWVSRKFNWKQFEELGLTEKDYHPTEVTIPFFLMHSATDTLFDYKDHYDRIVAEMNGTSNFKHWLVPDAGHTRMIRDPNYENQLVSFLKEIEIKAT